MSKPPAKPVVLILGIIPISANNNYTLTDILKDAPVVLLDEATSSLDPENEAEIQQAISRLVQGRTVVVIAHRLKTVTGADTILVLDQGRIVEQGTHKQLLALDGLYAKIWNLQTSSEGWKIN